MVTEALFKGVADPVRCRILEILGRSRGSVSEIASYFDISRPAISRHLRVLREAGLVSEVRDGRERIYRLEPGALEEGAFWLQEVAMGRGEPSFLSSRRRAGGPDAGQDPPGERGLETDWREW